MVLGAITGMTLYATIAYLAGFSPGIYGFAVAACSVVSFLIVVLEFEILYFLVEYAKSVTQLEGRDKPGKQ